MKDRNTCLSLQLHDEVVNETPKKKERPFISPLTFFFYYGQMKPKRYSDTKLPGCKERIGQYQKVKNKQTNERTNKQSNLHQTKKQNETKQKKKTEIM